MAENAILTVHVSPLDPQAATPTQRAPIRFRGRSFLAMVLAPVPPFAAWLADLDAMAASSPGFFGNRPILLDLAAAPEAAREELVTLVADLGMRGIRIMAIEGAAEGQAGPELPPLITGGRDGRRTEPVAPPAVEAEATAETEAPVEPRAPDDAVRPAIGLPSIEPSAAEPAPAEPVSIETAQSAPSQAAPIEPLPSTDDHGIPSLVVDAPVRSGQSVVFPEGDVTVIGSVASGAEVIAGGSIHIYGALRGRAIAGTLGQATSRIFCSRLEAELLAIDGLYFTADQMQTHLRGRPVQTWLSGDAMLMAALDEVAPATKR